ncbi:unnamed protein product [Mytilus coruscus]|uniref:YqaJ viral recombinase domain-containing protein n=1 Tax=Mytilus coruscus TaxID=42192 RepID=A0A6J8AYV3_MYTCO|nr:unnamed protein product [Mytilus coruscus]
MKIADINEKTTVEDFLTLKKSDLVLFLRSSSAKISGNKDELARRAIETNQTNNGVTASLSLGEGCTHIAAKYNIPQIEIDGIENRTVGQSENPLWFETRKFRITSSNFHQIVAHKKADVEKLVQSFSNPDKLINVAPLIWGRKHEPIARKKYIAHRRLKYGEKIFVKDCGIFLCDKFGFLGASPDGLVKKCTKFGEQKCVLEIKCPWKWTRKTIREACLSKDFFCEIDEQNNIQLKKSHKYFSQIQGQMGIC